MKRSSDPHRASSTDRLSACSRGLSSSCPPGHSLELTAAREGAAELSDDGKLQLIHRLDWKKPNTWSSHSPTEVSVMYTVTVHVILQHIMTRRMREVCPVRSFIFRSCCIRVRVEVDLGGWDTPAPLILWVSDCPIALILPPGGRIQPWWDTSPVQLSSHSGTYSDLEAIYNAFIMSTGIFWVDEKKKNQKVPREPTRTCGEHAELYRK